MQPFVGVILAGGQSRRFGSAKAFATRNEIPFYQYSIDALTPFCSSILVVTQPQWRSRFQTREQSLHINIIEDHPDFKGDGPLAGIYSAMERLEGEWYMVVPIDVPFIRSSVFQCLKEEVDLQTQGIVPVVAGKIQPLIAMYHHSAKGKMLAALSLGQRSLQNFLKKIKVKYIEMDDPVPFININRSEDFKRR